MALRLILFLVINYGALALGGLFTGKGVNAEWYSSLVKAPWTPPGWVFGFAWTTIMICFSFYMYQAWGKVSNLKMLAALFAVQWLLNVAWNPVFFYFNNALIGLIIISLLTILVGYLLINYWPDLKWYSLLILPYLIWLLIASSLNAYILINN